MQVITESAVWTPETMHNFEKLFKKMAKALAHTRYSFSETNYRLVHFNHMTSLKSAQKRRKAAARYQRAKLRRRARALRAAK